MPSPPQFDRSALYLMLGAPDESVQAGSDSRLLTWMCGCAAEERSTGRYVVRACAGHAAEFNEVPH